MDHDLRIDALTRRVETLEHRVGTLEAALFEGYLPPVEWSLTYSEARVMGVLVNRDMATKLAIMAALYADLNRDEPEPKIVDVFICKLRKKVGRYGVKIDTVYGQGFRLVDRSRYQRAA